MVITATGITIFGVFISFRILVPHAARLFNEYVGPRIEKMFSGLTNRISDAYEEREKRIEQTRNEQLRNTAERRGMACELADRFALRHGGEVAKQEQQRRINGKQ